MTLLEEFTRDYSEYHALSDDRRWRQQKFIVELLETIPSYWTSGTLDDLTAETLRAYASACVESGLQPNSVRQRLGVISPFIKWAWETKRIDAERYMELREIKPPRGASAQGKPRPYDRKQIEKFWSDLAGAYPWVRALHRNDHDTRERGEYYVARYRAGNSKWGRVQPYAKRLQIEAIVSLALHGGLRMAEIFRLQVEEMHHENEYVVARSKKNRRGEWVERAVPHGEATQAAIKAWLDFRASIEPSTPRPWLSLHQQHYLKPLPFRTFEMLLRKIGRGWEFHRMRHTFATEQLRAGMELEKLQRIMGHARIQQTLAYAELLSGDLVRASRRVETDFSKAVGRAA